MFWERFYNICLTRGTKPNSVAREIGISSGIITKWKSAGTLPKGETLIKIADYLDCSIDYLLGRTDSPEMSIKKAPLNAGATVHDNILGLAGRDGRYMEKELTPDQIDLFFKILDQFPNADNL